MTIVFGLVANYPFAMATGLGINTLVAVTIAPQMTLARGDGPRRRQRRDHRDPRSHRVPHGGVQRHPRPAQDRDRGRHRRCSSRFIGLVDAGFVRRLPDAANTTVPVGLGINGLDRLLADRGVRASGCCSPACWSPAGCARRILIGVLVTTVLAIVVEAIVARRPVQRHEPEGLEPRLPGAARVDRRRCPTSRSSATSRSARSPGCPRWRSRCSSSRSCSPTSSTRWAR